MGYNTQLRFKAKLKKDTPENILKFLKRTIIDGEIDIVHERIFFKSEDVLRPDIDHEFFDCERWYSLFHGLNWDEESNWGSKMLMVNGYWEINIGSEFKNRDSEIQKFIEWISPYILGRKKKQYLGYYRGENYEDRPQNIYIERP